MRSITCSVRAILLVLALGLLGGCVALSENHPTTENRVLTKEEQQYWVDRTDRQDKAKEWDRELERQSRDRFARDLGKN